MKDNIIRILCITAAICLLSGGTPFSVSAQSAVGEVQRLADDIVAYKLSQSDASSVQEWIDGALTDNAGFSSEWYILALSQYDSYDFSAYRNALIAYLDDHPVESAVSRQKYALTLIAAGSEDHDITQTANASIGEQGIMSQIYGLHLLNNGYSDTLYTVDDVKTKLLGNQLADGGWKVTGNRSDVDVTAMAVQALAPYYTQDTAVSEAIDRALSFLSSCQLGDGDYAGYGTPNCESTAQVITALSAVGIDCQTDSRFIKNGNTAIDGMRKYALSNGSFSHTADDQSDETATSQAFCAAVAYLRFSSGRTGLYSLDRQSVSTEAPTAEHAAYEDSVDNPSAPAGKWWLCLGIAVAAGVTSVILLCRPHTRRKNIWVIAAAALVLIVVVAVTDVQTADQYYHGETVDKEHVVGHVTVTIRCDTTLDTIDSAYIPEDGVILNTTDFAIESGDTVYDILIEAARTNRIPVESNGTGALAYVVGICYLYEYDCGDLSGWMYFVNGETPPVGCGEYVLQDGDTVEWFYTCELGNDLN